MVEVMIHEVEEKMSQNNNKYWSYKTGRGRLSCFDYAVAKEINEKGIGKICDIEITQSGGFSNISAFNGTIFTPDTTSSLLLTPENPADKNARLRRQLDCILAANQAFIAGKIEKHEITEHALGLRNLLNELDNENRDVQKGQTPTVD